MKRLRVTEEDDVIDVVVLDVQLRSLSRCFLSAERAEAWNLDLGKGPGLVTSSSFFLASRAPPWTRRPRLRRSEKVGLDTN